MSRFRFCYAGLCPLHTKYPTIDLAGRQGSTMKTWQRLLAKSCATLYLAGDIPPFVRLYILEPLKAVLVLPLTN